jgi:hypothetical protein
VHDGHLRLQPYGQDGQLVATHPSDQWRATPGTWSLRTDVSDGGSVLVVEHLLSHGGGLSGDRDADDRRGRMRRRSQPVGE